jgi:hypothetical protein
MRGLWHWRNTRNKQLHVEGFPVFYDTELPHLSIAEGLWPLRRYIRVGYKWANLDHRAKLAVLYHEAHHIRENHKWRRILALLTVPILHPRKIKATLRGIAYSHEYAADGFAKAKGYGADFARALMRHPEGPLVEDQCFHPPLELRLERLLDEKPVALDKSVSSSFSNSI